MNCIIFEFDKYLIEFPYSIKYTIYDHDYCYGIKFYIGNIVYDLVHNRQADWSRILITEGTGFKDIPFKDTSWHVLPDYIKVNNR